MENEECRMENGEGRREKGEGRREKGEGRRVKGEGWRVKGAEWKVKVERGKIWRAGECEERGELCIPLALLVHCLHAPFTLAPWVRSKRSRRTTKLLRILQLYIAICTPVSHESRKEKGREGGRNERGGEEYERREGGLYTTILSCKSYSPCVSSCCAASM